MPYISRSEFAVALSQVANERGIKPEVVLETIKAAILAAYRRDARERGLAVSEEELEVEVDPKTGEARIFQKEEEGRKDITPPGFGRIAAQTAKQVILQKIREAEKNAILEEFSGRVGNIISGIILRFDGPNILVEIGKAEAIMPPQEQVKSENYKIGQRLTFYIKEIKEGARGQQQIIVSRTDEGLVEGLFRHEVPEISSGAVEIKAIAREPGSRTKIAVFSKQAGIDPVGSCVGQKGIRVQQVINELGGEKIDVIQYSDDPKKFIAASLSPAENLRVEIKKKNALVFVSEDQLSLAIGKEGQNVRLAAKLTGFKIDIEKEEEKSD